MTSCTFGSGKVPATEASFPILGWLRSREKSIRGSLSGTHQLQDWKDDINLQAEVAECYSINFAHLLNVSEIFCNAAQLNLLIFF